MSNSSESNGVSAPSSRERSIRLRAGRPRIELSWSRRHRRRRRTGDREYCTRRDRAWPVYREPRLVVVAIPVAPPATVAELSTVADEVVCVATPEPFAAIGQWYRDFRPTIRRRGRRRSSTGSLDEHAAGTSHDVAARAAARGRLVTPRRQPGERTGRRRGRSAERREVVAALEERRRCDRLPARTRAPGPRATGSRPRSTRDRPADPHGARRSRPRSGPRSARSASTSGATTSSMRGHRDVAGCSGRQREVDREPRRVRHLRSRRPGRCPGTRATGASTRRARRDRPRRSPACRSRGGRPSRR